MQGLKYFEKGSWKKSKTFLSNYIKSFPESIEDFSTALYFMGKVQMNDELYKMAVENFNECIEIPEMDKNLKTNAEWERALCALRVDEKWQGIGLMTFLKTTTINIKTKQKEY